MSVLLRLGLVVLAVSCAKPKPNFSGPVALEVPGISLEERTFAGQTWRVTTVLAPALPRLDLVLRGDDGKPLRDVARVVASLQSAPPVWLMNAGMFNADGNPVGLFVAEGRELAPLRLEAGEGNFFLKPNGVFAVTGGGAFVRESNAWREAAQPKVRFATQSGPLLVRDGVLHPAFRERSDNRYVRNGVGVRADGAVVFVISTREVTFYELATFFRDELRCPDALYLDGFVSTLHAPKAGLVSDAKGLGPMLVIR